MNLASEFADLTMRHRALSSPPHRRLAELGERRKHWLPVLGMPALLSASGGTVGGVPYYRRVVCDGSSGQ